MKKGKQSVIFQKDIFINDATSYVGKRESEGNLRDYFQNVLKDDLMKEKSYELAETKMQKMTVEKLFEVSGKPQMISIVSWAATFKTRFSRQVFVQGSSIFRFLGFTARAVRSAKGCARADCLSKAETLKK